MTNQADLRAYVGSALKMAGASLTSEDGSRWVLDFTALDESPTGSSRREFLQTVTTLLLRADHDQQVLAILPRADLAQHALASCGVLFALAQTKAAVEVAGAPADLQPAQSDQLHLLDDAPFRRLVSDTEWSRDFTPAAKEFRDAVFGLRAGTPPRLGVVNSDHFVALVNPHRLPSGTLVREVGSLVGPWIGKALEVDDAHLDEGSPTQLLTVMSEALENCVQHAWNRSGSKRSLVTVEKVRSNGEDFLRLQVLDNGVGIPASLAEKRGETLASTSAAEELLERATNDRGSGLAEPRGRGLPTMRLLSRELKGTLTLATSGPGETQIILKCRADRPAQPYSDKLPVAGTVVTLRVPLDPLRK